MPTWPRLSGKSIRKSSQVSPLKKLRSSLWKFMVRLPNEQEERGVGQMRGERQGTQEASGFYYIVSFRTRGCMSRSVASAKHFNRDERDFIISLSTGLNGQACKPENIERICKLLEHRKEFNLRKVELRAVKRVLTKIRRTRRENVTRRRSRHRVHYAR